MNSVCILDYGSGNTRSVFNLFSSIADNVAVSNEPKSILEASHLILPGVGSFGAAMRKIGNTLPMDVLEQAVLSEGKPFLGICVGMQVLANRGMEFGDYPGLGWIAGTVRQLDSKTFPLPHVGWNSISGKRPSPLLAGLEGEPDFYFVHGFSFHAQNEEHVLATSNYGTEFCSMLQKDNIFGVQFHPEKSQRTGIKLATNFLSIQ